jgi:hypothetical protein
VKEELHFVIHDLRNMLDDLCHVQHVDTCIGEHTCVKHSISFHARFMLRPTVVIPSRYLCSTR